MHAHVLKVLEHTHVTVVAAQQPVSQRATSAVLDVPEPGVWRYTLCGQRPEKV